MRRIKAVLFIEMANNQVLGLRFMDRMRSRGIYGIELMDFKCMGNRQKRKDHKKRGYAYIKLPGPIIKRAWGVKIKQPEDYSWLNSFLPGTYSRAGDFSLWKHICATNFILCLERAKQMAGIYGRSVWFMARPLKGKCLRCSDSPIALSHWGILISQLTYGQMKERMASSSGNRLQIWGELHELRNLNGEAAYVCSRFSAADYQRGRVLKYLGQSVMTDEELDNHGNQSPGGIANAYL